MQTYIYVYALFYSKLYTYGYICNTTLKTTRYFKNLVKRLLDHCYTRLKTKRYFVILIEHLLDHCYSTK